jgi:hypothetical protein
MLSLNEPVLVEAYVPTSSIIYLDTLKLDVDFLSKGIYRHHAEPTTPPPPPPPPDSVTGRPADMNVMMDGRWVLTYSLQVPRVAILMPTS